MKLCESSSRMPNEKRYTKCPCPEFVTDDFLGVEVELEGFDGNATWKDPSWMVKADGSLRNGGVEFTFSRPLSGADAYNAIDRFDTYVNEYISDYHINPYSVRTSTHIHLNMDDITEEQYKKFLFTYLLFERQIFKAYASKRIGNHYCVPLHQTSEVLTAVSAFFRGHSDWKDFLYEVAQPGRYSALNQAALNKFQTVEFRMFPGETNKSVFYEWINLILSIKRFAIDNTQDIQVLLSEISRTGYNNFAYQVFSKQQADKLVGVSGFTDDFIRSIRLIQSFYVIESNKTPKLVRKAILQKKKEIEALKVKVAKDFDEKYDATRGVLQQVSIETIRKEENKINATQENYQKAHEALVSDYLAGDLGADGYLLAMNNLNAMYYGQPVALDIQRGVDAQPAALQPGAL